MKIRSKGNGFNEVFTEKDKLPVYIKPPKKKPFIILKLPYDPEDEYLEENFPTFKGLGYSSVIDDELIISITSKRKVAEVIEKICSSDDYEHPKNVTVLKQLKLIQQNLAVEINPPPPKSKEHAKYSIGEQIQRKSGTPAPSHKVQIVRKKNKTEEEVLKIVPSGRRITEIEAFNGICYRLLLNDRTPRVRSVHNAAGERVGILSRAIPNYQSLHDYYAKQKVATGTKQSPPQADLIKSGIGRVLAAAYCEEENDLHGGNIVYDPVEIKSYKVDHDQANWTITAKYHGFDPDEETRIDGRQFGIKPKDAFPITQEDLTDFPHLQDAKPFHFPDQCDNRILNLKDIEDNPEFIKDVFSVFLKRAVLDEEIYRNIAEATIGSPKLRDELVANKTNRSNLLKDELVQNEKFKKFIIENPNLKKQLMAEFEEYNNDYKDTSSPLRINLEELGTRFDAIFVQICPEETQDQIILDEILKGIIELDGKLGTFGGKQRKLADGKVIKIPKGAAAIFDLYMEHKNGDTTHSAITTLDAIIGQATKSCAFQGHGIFNKRQPETSAFYAKIMSIREIVNEENEDINDQQQMPTTN